jgi:hypothetical protein
MAAALLASGDDPDASLTQQAAHGTLTLLVPFSSTESHVDIFTMTASVLPRLRDDSSLLRAITTVVTAGCIEFIACGLCYPLMIEAC